MQEPQVPTFSVVPACQSVGCVLGRASDDLLGWELCLEWYYETASCSGRSMGAVFGRGIFFEVRRSCVWTVIAEGLRDNRSLFVHETVANGFSVEVAVL